MLDVQYRTLAIWAAVMVVISCLGLLLLRRSEPPAAAETAQPIRVSDDTGGGRVFVHVAGAVRRPGVYTLRAGARVADAVRRAGGARPGAELSAVNLASKLDDGRQVLVPRRADAADPAAAAAAAVPGAPAAPAVPIDLNTATLEQLDTLDGVGPATAQKILDYRTEHGGFGSVDELGQVPGIGDKRLAALRERVRV